MKNVMNRLIAYEAVKDDSPKYGNFVMPDNDPDKPMRGKIIKLGEFVNSNLQPNQTELAVGDVIVFNPSPSVGPFTEGDQEFFLVDRSALYFVV